MRTVYVVDKVQVAQVLTDPMRRAILDLLKASPMTQAQLAKELGLTGASLNYHMSILRSKRLVVMVRKKADRRRVVEKLFSPVAYLFVYDLNALPKSVARYFYPISLERAMGVIATLRLVRSPPFDYTKPSEINRLAEELSRSLVMIARGYARIRSGGGHEKVVHDIYTKAIKSALKFASA